MAKNLISLSDIVNDYILSRLDDSFDKYADPQVVRMAAVRTFRDLQLDATRSIKSLRLPVNTLRYTVTLPNDFISYTKIGVLVDGEIISIKVNNNLSIAEDVFLDNDGAEILDSNGHPLTTDIPIDELTGVSHFPNEITNAGYFFNNYQYGQFKGRLYGLGGGNNIWGECRFDHQNNIIQLEAGFRYEEIVLEYISDQSLDLDPMIPVQMENAMWDGMYSRIIDRSSSVPQSVKSEAKATYLRSKRHAKARLNSPTKQEILDSIYRRFQLAPKFGT
jgi:hypothetical protein